MGSPIGNLLSRQPVMILDGGLATALEARGFDLDDDLWSARLLLDDPDAIRQVHLDYLEAGADCITTASYQASIPGFRARGLGDAEGEELLRLSVRLACDARDAFWGDPGNRTSRLRPLVAASVGPYGAYLADGSEYTGDYGVGAGELTQFHRSRLETLAASEADLLACETIPSLVEVEVLADLLCGRPGKWAWISVSCSDGRRLCDGTALVEVVRLCDSVDNVAAIGVNCTAPDYVASLIAEARRGTHKPIIVYPNSGERYDAASKAWTGPASTGDWGALSAEWTAAGAAGVGGCCRVGPGTIAAVRRYLL